MNVPVHVTVVIINHAQVICSDFSKNIGNAFTLQICCHFCNTDTFLNRLCLPYNMNSSVGKGFTRQTFPGKEYLG